MGCSHALLNKEGKTKNKKGTVTESLCYELLPTVSILTFKPSPALDAREWYHYSLLDGGDSVQLTGG